MRVVAAVDLLIAQLLFEVRSGNAQTGNPIETRTEPARQVCSCGESHLRVRREVIRYENGLIAIHKLFRTGRFGPSLDDAHLVHDARNRVVAPHVRLDSLLYFETCHLACEHADFTDHCDTDRVFRK